MQTARWVLPLVLLAGCVTANVAPLSDRAYAPVAPENVIVYLDEDDVPDDHEQVAIIYLEGDYAATDRAKMIRKARKEAAEVGANAIVLTRMKEPSTGAKVAQAVVGTTANRRAEVIAIYVPAPPRVEAD